MSRVSDERLAALIYGDGSASRAAAILPENDIDDIVCEIDVLLDLRDERAAHAETKRKLDEAVELCDGVYTVRGSAWECAICGQDSTMFPRHSADCYGARFETFLAKLEDK